MEKYSKLGVHPALLLKFADIESVDLVEPPFSSDNQKG
jgi:hypothetical protein